MVGRRAARAKTVRVMGARTMVIGICEEDGEDSRNEGKRAEDSGKKVMELT